MASEAHLRSPRPPAPAAPAGASTRSRFSVHWTLGLKLVTTVAVAITLGFIALVAVQVQNERGELFSVARDHNLRVTAMLSREITGAVKWKKPERIAPVTAGFEKDARSALATFSVFDDEGAALADYHAERLAPYDLDGVLDRVKGRLAAGKSVEWVTETHQVVVVPVIDPKDQLLLGTLAVAWSLEQLNARVDKALTDQVLISVAIVFGLVVALALLLHMVVTRPIRTMTGAMSRLAEGDGETDVAGLGRGDEIGAMARAVQVFKVNAQEIERMRAEEAAAEERRREAVMAERRAAMLNLAGELETSVKAAIDAISESSESMRNSARQTAGTVDQAGRQSSVIAAAAEEATANVQTVAAAAEELSASVSEIERQVAQSARIAERAVQKSHITNQTVEGLAAAARKISEVVDLINDIAGQTNLLALNATIEAARAGEAGKGFAVVASEVKNLANQTARATEEIAEQVNTMQAVTRDAVQAIDEIGSIIREVNDIAGAISTSIEQQAASTQEIASNVQQAAQGTREVAESISGVGRAVNESGQSAASVLVAAERLSSLAESLQSEVEKFLSGVRAA